MIKLTKELIEQGFFIISPIYWKNREFIKCGNINNNFIYFMEIVNRKISAIENKDILDELEQLYIDESDNKVY